MKKLLFAIATSLLITTITFGQTHSINSVTQHYLEIQTALAKDDAVKAGTAAMEFNKEISNINMNDISSRLHPVFMQNQKALIGNSKDIATTKDIKTQRKVFIALSQNMIALAKTDKISNIILYEDYCPMKKASWLSSEKDIQNPYFGSSMPDCGKVITKHE